jgi:hypothetical protein
MFTPLFTSRAPDSVLAYRYVRTYVQCYFTLLCYLSCYYISVLIVLATLGMIVSISDIDI